MAITDFTHKNQRYRRVTVDSGSTASSTNRARITGTHTEKCAAPGERADILKPHARKSGCLQDLKMPDPKDDPKSPEWRPYTFVRDQWHCRICGDSFQYSETVRKHIADAHDEKMPPSMYEYFRGAVWQRKKIP
jgi:hypothetical protein